MRSPIVRPYEIEKSAYRITQRQPMTFVPKSQGVEKRFLLGVLKLQLPVVAAVCRFVDARVFARPDAQQVSHLRAKSFDVAEVQLFRTRHMAHAPGRSPIRSLDERTAGA